MSALQPKQRVGLMTSGGLAPCLSAAVGFLIDRYNTIDPTIEILCYRAGYKGLLTGDSFVVDAAGRASALELVKHGGSPIGNSRVKLTNIDDCEKKGFVRKGELPLAVAAKQLVADGVTILHTIGGDDTNTQAAELAKYLADNDYKLTVVGLPKTIDNDVIPIKQSLGAWTAAEHGARFFRNVVAESSCNPRMLIIHECMGRDCGYLTAATAAEYRKLVAEQTWVPSVDLDRRKRDLHACYLPETDLDIDAEAVRLKTIMDENDSVNIFLSEGAGVSSIIAEMEARGENVPRDAFGHVRISQINPGAWFAKQFAEKIGAGKVLVQKSGYYSRAAPANEKDCALIKECCDLACASALKGEAGCVGHDEERGDVLRAIEFPRIKGGKAFDTSVQWYGELLAAIGQPR